LNLTGASKPEGLAVLVSAGLTSVAGDLEVYQAAAAAATAADATAAAPYLLLRKGMCSLMAPETTDLNWQSMQNQLRKVLGQRNM